MEQARRQITFRVFVALAFVWGCVTFAAGVSWLRSAFSWARDNRAVEWQQYTMSALLLSFALLVLLGTRRPRLALWLFLLMFAVAILQVLGVTASTGDGIGEAVVGCMGLIGVPSLLAAWLFGWRSRWKPAAPSRTISSR